MERRLQRLEVATSFIDKSHGWTRECSTDRCICLDDEVTFHLGGGEKVHGGSNTPQRASRAHSGSKRRDLTILTHRVK